MNTELHALSRIAALAEERALARLAQAEAACRAIEARLPGPAPAVAEGAALLSGAAERHDAWCRARRAELLPQLARAAAEREAARTAARRAFGRAEVFRSLLGGAAGGR